MDALLVHMVGAAAGQETTCKLGDLLAEAERLGIGPALGALALLQRARRQQET